VSRLLAFVTHFTNIPRQRGRVKADHVAQLALRRRLERHRNRPQPDSVSELKALNDELFRELDALGERNASLQASLESEQLAKLALEEEYQDLENKHGALRYQYRQLLEQPRDRDERRIDISTLVDIATRGDEPTPEDCLSLVESLYPTAVEVLPSAYVSAKEHSQFSSGRRLLNLLCRLSTEFVAALVEGGDNAARKVFTTSEYAATESETTRNNGVMRQKRTFVYKGMHIQMFRHLKIGVADDQRKSIRVYFEWVPDEKKIVIGHCGKHLPVVSH
jgi:hypothetical protein